MRKVQGAVRQGPRACELYSSTVHVLLEMASEEVTKIWKLSCTADCAARLADWAAMGATPPVHRVTCNAPPGGVEVRIRSGLGRGTLTLTLGQCSCK